MIARLPWLSALDAFDLIVRATLRSKRHATARNVEPIEDQEVGAWDPYLNWGANGPAGADVSQHAGVHGPSARFLASHPW